MNLSQTANLVPRQNGRSLLGQWIEKVISECSSLGIIMLGPFLSEFLGPLDASKPRLEEIEKRFQPTVWESAIEEITYGLGVDGTKAFRVDAAHNGHPTSQWVWEVRRGKNLTWRGN